jgi:hypothetical protein
MIDFLLHVYRRGEEPFRSLSALPEEEAARWMENLYVAGSVFWERFKNPKEYIDFRRRIENRLRTEFIAKGGRPPEPYPIYMMLGRSKWLDTAGDAATLATTEEIRVPLSLFSEGDVSFTYPDSMVTFSLAEQKDAPFYQPEYFGKVFTLPEISALVEALGLPGERWGADLPPDMPNFIEAQVWNHRVLLDFRRGATHA